jgi:Predicted 3'-5' exonuclease related to the exonuclease domain of PolB
VAADSVMGSDFGTAQPGEVRLGLIGARTVHAERDGMIDPAHIIVSVQRVPTPRLIKRNGVAAPCDDVTYPVTPSPLGPKIVAGPAVGPGEVRPERGLPPSGHCVPQLQNIAFGKVRFSSQPLDFAANLPPTPSSRTTVRWSVLRMICGSRHLPGKPEGIDGSRVEEMVLAGQIEEVARYCESDVLNTYRVWLVYELFRGAITADQLAWSEGRIQEFVANRKTANPHLCAAVGIPPKPCC